MSQPNSAYAANTGDHVQRRGTVISGYRLVRRLGAGGMGSVWEARDPGGERVAMKILHPALAADPAARRRLEREAQVLARVRGRGVARVLDVESGGGDGTAFVVTELVDGPTLQSDVETNSVYDLATDGAEYADLAHGIAQALREVHAAGVIHRDLKPSNVMLGADGPVLIDFGISQLAGDARLTVTGQVTGTPGFIPPEVLEGAAPDEAGDWYAMAGVLLFALTGRPPFGAGSWQTVFHRVTSGNVELGRLEALAPALAKAFVCALDPDPEHRMEAETLLAVIDEVVEGGDGFTALGPWAQQALPGEAEGSDTASSPGATSLLPGAAGIGREAGIAGTAAGLAAGAGSGAGLSGHTEALSPYSSLAAQDVWPGERSGDSETPTAAMGPDLLARELAGEPGEGFSADFNEDDGGETDLLDLPPSLAPGSGSQTAYLPEIDEPLGATRVAPGGYGTLPPSAPPREAWQAPPAAQPTWQANPQPGAWNYAQAQPAQPLPPSPAVGVVGPVAPVSTPSAPQPQPELAPAWQEMAPSWASQPGAHRPLGLMLLLVAIACAAWNPLVAGCFIVGAAVICGGVGRKYRGLHERWRSKGGPSSGDEMWLHLHWPGFALRTLIAVLADMILAGFLTSLVLVILGGSGEDPLGIGSVTRNALGPSFTGILHALLATSVYTLTMWRGPATKSARYGARVLMDNHLPGGGARSFLFLGCAALGTLLIVSAVRAGTIPDTTVLGGAGWLEWLWQTFHLPPIQGVW